MSARGLGIVLLWLLPLALATAEPADPTAPPGRHGNPGQPAQGGWELHSTLIGPERRSAIINGRSVGIGDQIAGARVARIEAGEVLLDTPERRIQLRLLPTPPRIHPRE
jgi:hypothetical protein